MKKTIASISLIAISIVTGLNANTFTDIKTNLMWQDTQDVIEEKRNYDNAIEYCEELSLDGYTDWRLPTIIELNSIVDYSKSDPAIINGFQNIVFDFYWSSTVAIRNKQNAWLVFFGSGGDYIGTKYEESLVRCVRDTKEPLTFDSFSSLLKQALKYEISKKLKEPQKKELIKGQFEKTADFEARVAKEEELYEKAMTEYKNKYAQLLIKSKQKAILKSLQIYYGKPFLQGLHYDADKELFSANLKFENDNTTIEIEFKMAPQVAEKFYESYSELKYEVVFESDEKSIKGKKLQFMFDKKLYTIALLEDEIKDEFRENE